MQAIFRSSLDHFNQMRTQNDLADPIEVSLAHKDLAFG
jgi:hypothetical protein